MTAFWDTAPCSLDDEDTTNLRNVGQIQRDYIAIYPRKLYLHTRRRVNLKPRTAISFLSLLSVFFVPQPPLIISFRCNFEILFQTTGVTRRTDRTTRSVKLSICVYCMYVCMYACMYVCRLCVCVCMCVYVSMYVCMYVCMHVCVYVCMYVCMYVCVYVCMYACVCMCYARSYHLARPGSVNHTPAAILLKPEGFVGGARICKCS
jgi:hypothetical protein